MWRYEGLQLRGISRDGQVLTPSMQPSRPSAPSARHLNRFPDQPCRLAILGNPPSRGYPGRPRTGQGSYPPKAQPGQRSARLPLPALPQWEQSSSTYLPSAWKGERGVPPRSQDVGTAEKKKKREETLLAGDTQGGQVPQAKRWHSAVVDGTDHRSGENPIHLGQRLGGGGEGKRRGSASWCARQVSAGAGGCHTRHASVSTSRTAVRVEGGSGRVAAETARIEAGKEN